MQAAHACGQRALASQHAQRVGAEADLREASVLQGRMQCEFGWLAADDGQIEQARRHYADALQIARQFNQPLLCCTTLNALASSLMDHGAIDEARPHFLEALGIAQATGLKRWEAAVLGNLGNLELELGMLVEARDHFEAALSVAQRAGDLKFSGNQLSNLGLLDHLADRSQDARRRFDSALTIAREIGHRHLECVVLCNLGMHFDSLRLAAESTQHFEQAIGVARELQDRRSEGQALGYLGLAHARAGRFNVARQCLEDGQSLLLDLADPISMAVLWCSRAEVESMDHQFEAARQYLGKAESLARDSGAGLQSELGLALGRVRRQLADATAFAPATTSD